MSDPIINTKITADTAQAEQAVRTLKRSISDMSEDSSKSAMSTKSAWSDAIGGIGSSWANMASAFAAGNIITKALDVVLEKLSMLKEAVKDAILMSARYETLGVVMKVVGANAGYTASQMAGFQKGLQATGISAIEARQGLMLMGQAQVDMANSSKLARIAQDAAVIGNINSSEAFNRMMTGLATGQSILMHHLGLMTNFETAYLNAAHAAGKTTNDLTEVEKAQIRVNEVLRAGVGISGSYEAAMGTAGKQLNSMKRYVDDLMVQFGGMFQGALIAGVTALANSLKYVSGHFEEIKIAAMGAASVLAGAAMYAAAPLMLSLAGAVGTVLMALNGFAYALITADGAAIAATFSFNALKVAMATNPLGLIIAALTTAAGLWMTYIKVQSDAIDRNAPKDNPVLVTLREEVSLLQSKIDLIRKSKGLETATDPQVLELKRLEMQKQFIKDQDGSSGAGFRVTATEMERANIEKLIPQVAALKKEYAGLIKEKDKPSKPDNSWVSEANSLVGAYNQLQLETHKVDQNHSELYRTLDVLDEKEKSMIQTLQDGSAQSKKHWAEQGISVASITTAFEKLQEAAIIKADNKDYWDGVNARWREGKHEIDQVEQAIKRVFALGKNGEESPLYAFADDVHKATLAFTQAGDAFGVTAEAYVSAIEGAVSKLTGVTLKGLNSQNTDLAASQVGVDMSTGQVTDPYAQQQAMMEARYKKEFDLIDERTQKIKDAMQAESNSNAPNLTVYGKLQDQMLASSKNRTLHEKQQTIDQKKIDEESFRGRLSAASQYTNMAGQFFTALASTQDQSSRSGFESAKAFNIAAATMSTASAVMNALATVQPYPMALAAAALAAATGVIQIAKIASTSFGGGGGVSAPAGSYAGGGATGGASTAQTGSARGSSIADIANSKDGKTLDLIAARMGNASLAMGESSKALTKIADIFTTKLGMSFDNAPNQYANIQGKDGFMQYSGLSAGLDSWKKNTLANVLTGGALATITAIGTGISNALFGGSWKSTGAGITLGVANGDLAGQSYSTSHKSGGLFSSSKDKTDYSALDAGFLANMNSGLDMVSGSVRNAAVTLGQSGTLFDENMKKVNIAAISVATAGRTNTDIQKDVEAAFTSMSNQMITQTLPDLSTYAKGNEAATDTISRLATSLIDVNRMFELVGRKPIDASYAGGDLASRYADAFGGLEPMAKAMDTYFTAMFTEPEQAAKKAALAQKDITAAFTKMGIEIPKTNKAFDDLRTSTTDPELFVALTNLGPTFAEITKQADALAAASLEFAQDLTVRLLNVTGQTGLASIYAERIKQEKELSEAKLAGMDTTDLVTLHTLEMAVVVKKAATDISEATQKIVDSTKKALTDSIGLIQSILNTKKTLLTGPAAMLSQEAAYKQAKSQLAGSDGNTVSANVTAFVEASKNFAVSKEAYQRDYQAALAKLDQFSGTTGGLSDVEKQLELLGKIAKAVGDNDGALVSVLSAAWLDAQVQTGAADGYIKQAIDDLQATLNTNVVTGTAKPFLDSELARLQATLATAIANGTAHGQLDIQISDLKATLNTNVVTGTAKGILATGIDDLQSTLNTHVTTGTAAGLLATDFSTIGSTLTTGLDSFVTKLGLYVQAMNNATTQAGVNQTLLANQNVAIDAFTAAATTYQTTSAGLISQYKAGSLSPADYKTQNDAAYAPVSAAYTTATGLGITSLPSPVETGFTAADTDARMKLKAADAAKYVYDQWAYRINRMPYGYNADYDLDKNGMHDAYDQIYWNRIASGAITYSSLGLPAFAAGTNYLPSDMIAQVHEGERIIPKADNYELMQRLSAPAENGSNKALEAKLEALLNEVQQLRNEQKAGHVAIAKNTGDSAKQLRRWDGEGTPPVREAA